MFRGLGFGVDGFRGLGLNRLYEGSIKLEK